MKIRLKKVPNGRPVITVVRADGSSTSGGLAGAAGFGPVHDLAHYAVETHFGLQRGFYGLLASGWNIPDFEVPGASAKFPDESVVVECLVGQLTPVAFSAQPMSATDFSWLVAEAVKGVRPGAAVPVLDAAGFEILKTRFRSLVNQWRDLRDGESLELDFPVTTVTPTAVP